MTGDTCVIVLDFGTVFDLPDGRRYRIVRGKGRVPEIKRVWRIAPAGGESPGSGAGSPSTAKGEQKPVGERIKELMG